MNSHFVLMAATTALCAASAFAAEHCVNTSHGCVALNPDVVASTLHQTICKKGYTRTVRPATSYIAGVKSKLMRQSGIPISRANEFELDHIVPLSLGGHPRALSNLMLQEWDGPAGAHVKDKLEVMLQRRVCRGGITLAEAQYCIAEDWQVCLAQYRKR